MGTTKEDATGQDGGRGEGQSSEQANSRESNGIRAISGMFCAVLILTPRERGFLFVGRNKGAGREFLCRTIGLQGKKHYKLLSFP